MRFLTAIPVYNEERHLEAVLQEVRRYSPHILVVNDGSTDRTPGLLARQDGIDVVTHPKNRGLRGRPHLRLRLRPGDTTYEVLVTMDCDGQHEPARIAVLLEAIHDADIVSGSRYLRDFRQDALAPQDRRLINQTITAELNDRFGLHLTDAFCGFKAYRREALCKLHITETGWGMPLQLWVQAARAGLAHQGSRRAAALSGSQTGVRRRAQRRLRTAGLLPPRDRRRRGRGRCRGRRCAAPTPCTFGLFPKRTCR